MQQLNGSLLTVITGETTAHKLEGREEGAWQWNSAALSPSKKLTDALSMERQHREAAENNRRKPIRVGVGRSSKQTSEI